MEADDKAEAFDLHQRTALLAQSEEETAAEYLRRGEGLAKKLSTMDSIIGYNVVKGMKNEVQRSRVTFECIKDQDFIIKNLEKIMSAAYQVIGQLSPFDPDFKRTGNNSLSMPKDMSGDD